MNPDKHWIDAHTDLAISPRDPPAAITDRAALVYLDPAEPMFVLRANDPLAADLVDLWATRTADCVVEHASHEAARAASVAVDMREWRARTEVAARIHDYERRTRDYALREAGGADDPRAIYLPARVVRARFLTAILESQIRGRSA